jgi:hypothetical protein
MLTSSTNTKHQGAIMNKEIDRIPIPTEIERLFSNPPLMVGEKNARVQHAA